MDKMVNENIITTDTISDNEIITRVLEGEKNLYALLVRRYNQRLYRVCMSIIKNDAEAEDVMQETYIHAFQNLGKFAYKSSFSTWLTRIVINESLLRIKKRNRSFSINADKIENEMYELKDGKEQNPLMKVINAELKAVLEEAIYQLPEKYRTVFILREIEDMNIAETQECLDLSEVNVKVRLNRAKAMLRNSLNAFYKKEDILHFHLSRCNKVTEFVMEKIALL